jgi:hypothetical protein
MLEPDDDQPEPSPWPGVIFGSFIYRLVVAGLWLLVAS